MELIEITLRLLELRAWELQLNELQDELFHELVVTRDRRLRLEDRAIQMGIELY